MQQQQDQVVRRQQEPLGQRLGAGIDQLERRVEQTGQHVQQSVLGGQQPTADTQCVFDFTVQDHMGKPYPLSQHRGQCLLIVNIDTECSNANNCQAALETLFQRYKDKNFNILAFPCTDFFSGNRRDDVATRDFILQRWPNSGYPILGKIHVNGDEAAPLFNWLKSQEKGAGTLINAIKWDYTSFLCDQNGRVVARYAPGIDVEKIEKDLLPLVQQSGASGSVQPNVNTNLNSNLNNNNNVPVSGMRAL